MVLWKGGISFGGVVAFIFADLIIAPILNIYRKYYGPKMAAFLLGTFYTAMAVAGYVIELVFGGLGLVPSRGDARRSRTRACPGTTPPGSTSSSCSWPPP